MFLFSRSKSLLFKFYIGMLEKPNHQAEGVGFEPNPLQIFV